MSEVSESILDTTLTTLEALRVVSSSETRNPNDTHVDVPEVSRAEGSA